MMESEEKVVTLPGMDEEALEELVNFAYCGKVGGTVIHPSTNRPWAATGGSRRISAGAEVVVVGWACR